MIIIVKGMILYFIYQHRQLPKCFKVALLSRKQIPEIAQQESLALASMARDDLPASSTAAAMRSKVGSEFET